MTTIPTSYSVQADVLTLGHQRKVVEPDTGFLTTKVVHDLAFWDRPYFLFVKGPIRRTLLPFDRNIRSVVWHRLPYPAWSLVAFICNEVVVSRDQARVAVMPVDELVGSPPKHFHRSSATAGAKPGRFGRMRAFVASVSEYVPLRSSCDVSELSVGASGDWRSFAASAAADAGWVWSEFVHGCKSTRLAGVCSQ